MLEKLTIINRFLFARANFGLDRVWFLGSDFVPCTLIFAHWSLLISHLLPQFQSKEVETLHAASTHKSASFRQCEAGLHGLRGRQLICTLSSLSFKARRLKLCMQPQLMTALVLGHVRPASTASEAVSWYALLVASISKLGGWNFACSLDSWMRSY